MLGVPEGIDAEALIDRLAGVEGVRGLHRVHVWAMEEHAAALDAHVVVDDGTDGRQAARLRRHIATVAGEEFGITPLTLQIETASEQCAEDDRRTIGHAGPARA
jgi:cobalt-zinc-cadmium efflux system protein